MHKYILIQKVYDGDRFHNPEVLGTFDHIIAVNLFLRSEELYPENVKFFSCRQICEFPVGDTKYQLDLTSVPHNPVNKIGELKRFFEEEPTIKDLEEQAETQPLFLDFKKGGYSVHTYPSKDSMSLQFWGWAIVLKEDGTYFWEDTSGG